MICDFCRHEVVIPESRELLIRAWCPNCGAFSDGKERMRLPDLGPFHLARLLRQSTEEARTYRNTCKAAQENGTNLWNKIVHVRNLLRVAQPYLEEDNARNPDELELAALCNEIEKEIGSLENNVTADDGKMIAERLGIDMEKWAEEIRAKIDAAAAVETDVTSTVETHAAVGPCLCGVTHNKWEE